MASSNPSSRTDRKTIERFRRNQMTALYSKLNSLLPHHKSSEAVSLPDQLDEAAKYIVELQINLEKMKEKKDRLMGIENPSGTTAMNLLNLPNIEIHSIGSAIEVTLITGLDCQFMFFQAIRLLHEGGAEIVSASFYVVGDKMLHTIHSKMEEAATASDGAARISERIMKLVHAAIA